MSLRLWTLAGALIANLVAPLASAQIYSEYRPGMALGMGYDGLNGELKNECVVGSEVTDNSAGTGSFTWEETNTSDEIRKTFEISAGLAYKAITTSASGKAKFLNRASSDRSSVTISAVNRSTTKVVRLSNVSLNKKFRDPIALRFNCGTHYISAIVWGGEFFASLYQLVDSKEEKDEFELVAKASGQSLKSDLNVASSLETSRFNSTIHIEGARAGGSSTVYFTPKELRAAFSSFQADVAAGKQSPIQIVLMPLPTSGLKSDELQRLTTLEDAVTRIYSIRDFNFALTAVAKRPNRYFVDPQTVAANAAAIATKAQSIDRALREQMQKCVAPKGSLRRDCNFGRYPVAPLGTASGLPDLYEAACDTPWQPPSYGAEFSALPHVGGDEATGGNDIVEITTQYDAAAKADLVQTTTVDIHESAPWDTRFRKSLTRRLLSTASGSKCVVKTAFTAPPSTGSVGLGDHENDYRSLTFDTDLVASAVCRTNKHGGDIGFAGCSSITFKPLAISLDHLENVSGSAIPRLDMPKWLSAAPS